MLFACSRCFSRHPFEELSPGQQLCKECRGSFPVVKCTFCRSEFQQTSKGSTSTICKKCEQNVKLYRKPTACEYCNIIAAFIGNKCQRCTNSEKRYGAPVTCEQCKQKCAFDRKDEDKKVDGKLLCWLCTLSYKRALAKTKQSAHDRREHQRLTRERERDAKRREQAGRPRSHNKRPQRADVTKLPAPSSDGKDSLDGPPAKVPRPAVSRVDPHDPEHVVAMTQLKEKIVSLNKQLSLKDQQLLSKDKMITELKAKHFTVETELRNRMLVGEREFKTKSEMMSSKIKNLQKEVATLSKMKSTPKVDRKRVVEIKDKERIRTIDPKEYLKKKLKKSERNDSDQKDTDNEDKEERKSRNTISDDEDDDSKDASIKDVSIKEVKKEKEEVERNGEKEKEYGEENGEKQQKSGSVDVKMLVEGLGSERNGVDTGSQVENESVKKDSDDESFKKERLSEKDSVKGDSDKESDNESSKKGQSSDKESVKGESDKESRKCDSDKESVKGDSDKDSTKEDSDKDSTKEDSDKESTKADSDKDSDDDSPRKKNSSSDDESPKKRRISSDDESPKKQSNSSDDEPSKKRSNSSDDESPKKHRRFSKKRRNDSDRESDKESDKDSDKESDKDSDRDSDKDSDKSEDKSLSGKDSDSDSDA